MQGREKSKKNVSGCSWPGSVARTTMKTKLEKRQQPQKQFLRSLQEITENATLYNECKAAPGRAP